MKKLKPRNALIITRLDEFVATLFSDLKTIGIFKEVRLLHPSDQVSYSGVFLADTILLDLKALKKEEYSDLIRVLSSIYQVKTLIIIMDSFNPDICRELRGYGADGYIHRGMSITESLDKIVKMVVHHELLLYTID